MAQKNSSTNSSQAMIADDKTAQDSHGNAAIFAAAFANAGIALAKFVGFLLTGASSMMAEAVHSLADTSNQALLLLGKNRAKKAADDSHQFGYSRNRYFYSFVVALVIFSLGAAFSLYEGVSKMMHPHELESPIIAVSILLVAIVLEGYSFRTALKESKEARQGTTIFRYIRSTKDPELPVLILEDFGALIGLILALCGVGLSLLTGNARFDALATIGIGLLLGSIAIILMVEMKSLLVGESASPELQKQLAAQLEQQEVIESVIYVRTEYLGPDDLLVAAKIAVAPHVTMQQVARAIDAAEKTIRHNHPEVERIFIEPDIKRPITG